MGKSQRLRLAIRALRVGAILRHFGVGLAMLLPGRCAIRTRSSACLVAYAG